MENEPVLSLPLVISIISSFIAIISAIIAYFSLHTQKEMTKYTYLANVWYEIRNKEFDNPDFLDVNMTSSYKEHFQRDMLNKYQIYAWVCWAHAEDIFLNNFHGKRAYKPTMLRYKELHNNWLQDNREYFDEKFLSYIDSLI